MKLHAAQKIILTPLMTILTFWVLLSFIVGPVKAFQAGLGLYALLILPGLTLSYALWDISRWSVVERFLISMGLSVAIIPTSMLVLNKYGILINLPTTVVVIASVSIIGLMASFIRNYFFDRKKIQRTTQ